MYKYDWWIFHLFLSGNNITFFYALFESNIVIFHSRLAQLAGVVYDCQ